MIDRDEIKKRFGFHPATEVTKPLHETMRQMYAGLAALVVDEVPEGREQSLALTALQDSMMWANAAIACNLAPLEGQVEE